MLSSIPTRFDGAWIAAWVRESDEAMRGDLERRPYALDTSTRAMGMALGDIRLPRPGIDLGPPDWFEYLRFPEAIKTNQFKAIADVAFGCLGRLSASYTRAGDLE